MDKDVEIVEIEVNGRLIQAKKGQVLSSVLWQEGIKTLGRSHKMNLPRGLYCGIGRCQSCVVEIDGIRKRSCITTVEQGMVIRGEHN